jgi:hypothetical protein
MDINTGILLIAEGADPSDVASTLIDEAIWSGKVKTKWSPPEGFFTRSAEAIAKGLKSASSGLKQAMSRLNFYINRSGRNLSKDERDRLKLAKEKLRASYA